MGAVFPLSGALALHMVPNSNDFLLAAGAESQPPPSGLSRGSCPRPHRLKKLRSSESSPRRVLRRGAGSRRSPLFLAWRSSIISVVQVLVTGLDSRFRRSAWQESSQAAGADIAWISGGVPESLFRPAAQNRASRSRRVAGGHWFAAGIRPVICSELPLLADSLNSTQFRGRLKGGSRLSLTPLPCVHFDNKVAHRKFGDRRPPAVREGADVSPTSNICREDLP